MNKSVEEQILVVPRTKLFRHFVSGLIPHGFGTDNLKELLDCIYDHARFIERPRAENDASLKQIIPYLLITYKDKVYLLQRRTAQTEARLHHKYSIGVGGHINPELKTPKSEKEIASPLRARNDSKSVIARSPENIRDDEPISDVREIINRGLERELHEELSVRCPYKYRLIGYLNDDTNLVGQVHFGLVYKLEVTNEKGIEVKEKDLMKGNFTHINELKDYYDRMETWSQILTRALFLTG